MAKINRLNFIEGAVAGVVLGVAATIFMSSKTGKKLRSQAEEAVGDFYKQVAPKLKKAGKMTKHEYDAFMKKAAQEYGKARKMSEQKIKELAKEAQGSFKHVQKTLSK